MKEKITNFISIIILIVYLAFLSAAQDKNSLNNEQNTKQQFSESIVEKVVLTEKSKKKSKKKTSEAINNQNEKIIIPVIAYKSDGEIVKGLKQDDFTVFENGIEQEITYFKNTDEKITVVLMFDISNSANMKFDLAKESFVDFIDKIRRQDRIIAVSFDEKTKLIGDTDNIEREEIKKKIKKIAVGGGTSLYDSIDFTLSKFLSGVEEPKAFILFTDGVDTTSQKNSINEILKKVSSSNAVFSVIYNDTFNDFASKKSTVNNANLTAILADILKNGGVSVGSPRRTARAGISPEEYRIGINFLNDLVLLSGGTAVKPEATLDGFKTAFAQIYSKMTSQNFIGYSPKNNSLGQQAREIKVRINRPDLFVRTRASLTFEEEK